MVKKKELPNEQLDQVSGGRYVVTGQAAEEAKNNEKPIPEPVPAPFPTPVPVPENTSGSDAAINSIVKKKPVNDVII